MLLGKGDILQKGNLTWVRHGTGGEREPKEKKWVSEITSIFLDSGYVPGSFKRAEVGSW